MKKPLIIASLVALYYTTVFAQINTPPATDISYNLGFEKVTGGNPLSG